MYAMGIFETVGGRGRTAEEMSGPGLLTELSEQRADGISPSTTFPSYRMWPPRSASNSGANT